MAEYKTKTSFQTACRQFRRELFLLSLHKCRIDSQSNLEGGEVPLGKAPSPSLNKVHLSAFSPITFWQFHAVLVLLSLATDHNKYIHMRVFRSTINYFSYPKQGLLNFERRDDEKEQLCNGGTYALGQEAQSWAKALFCFS